MHISQDDLDRFLKLYSFNNDAKQMVNISRSNKESPHVTGTISAITTNILNLIVSFEDRYGSNSKDLITNEMRHIIVNKINEDVRQGDDDYDKKEKIYKNIESLFPFLKRRNLTET